MRTSLLFVALLFTACTDDATEPGAGTLPGPTVAKEICPTGCSDDLIAQIENLEFLPVRPQVDQPGDDPVFFVEASPGIDDPCVLDGVCEYTCRRTARQTADACQLLHCALTDGRLLIGRTCR